jgi:hypothetical protein
VTGDYLVKLARQKCTRICASLSLFLLALWQTEEIRKFARFTEVNSLRFEQVKQSTEIAKTAILSPLRLPSRQIGIPTDI